MFKLNENVKVNENLKTIQVSHDVRIHTRTISAKEGGKTAIYIHGGGSGGNHTMLVRPAKWMIAEGLFDTVILPDRRGEGKSSPISAALTIKDHAQDMKDLLDKLEINGKVTAMGISYGGPVALTLASMDERIDEVVLFASSPSLRSAKGLTALLNKMGVLESIVRSFYTKNVGKAPEAYPDLDAIYDISDNGSLNKIFLDAIKSTDASRLESLLMQNRSTLDRNNSSIDESISLNIPIYQVIGDKDEVWETDLSDYSKRFPNIVSTQIKKANHKASLLDAGKFYEAFLNIYKK